MKDILLIYRGRVFDTEIKPRLEQFKNDNITLVTENKLTRNLVSHLIKDLNQKINLVTVNEFLGDNIITKFMKFKKILGNPPYQDGTQDGGQNKIYNQISKKSLSLLDFDGEIHFTTPTSVLKKSKRFSLIGIDGLREVDFTSNDEFKEGVDICSWVVDKTYRGKYVDVFTQNGKETQLNNGRIYDFSKIDEHFIKIYESIKKKTDVPENRMFKHNNFGPAFSKKQSKNNIYPIYKLENEKEVINQYSSRLPVFHQKEKLIIPIAKSLIEKMIFVSKNDYDSNYMVIDFSDKNEINNIKQFLLSEYFTEFSKKWKSLEGYGFNVAVKHLPPFDKTKSWSNDEVKDFIESFLND
jgi:hypothetical protein